MDEPERCPQCGTRADATAAVAVRLAPDARDRLLRHADIVRRELALPTEDEAIAEAVRRVAFQLHRGEGVTTDAAPTVTA